MIPALAGTASFAQTLNLPPGQGTAAPDAPASTATAPINNIDTMIPWPAGLSMPVRLLGIDASDAGDARSALTAVEKTLPGAWLTAPKTLTQEIAGRHTITINAKKRSDKIFAGTPRTAAPIPLAVEPAWCAVMDRYVLFVSVVDAAKNTLLASAHTAIPRSEWDSMVGRKSLDADLPRRFQTLLAEAMPLAAARAAAMQTPADALHLALDLGRNTTRADEGSSECLAMLLEAQLSSEFTMVRATGADELATVRDLLGQPPKLSRPTRRVVLRWFNRTGTNSTEIAAKRALPVSLTLEASFSESVGGRTLGLPLQKSNWQIAAAGGGKLSFPVDANLKKFLAAARQSLVLADSPQIAKIDRAWVYLDRGRAFGLKMGDRLVADDGKGGTIKGHVVRYFGSEEKIKSPRGYPVEEGAILYIRKGQRSIKVGQAFNFDPKVFPAAWPPVKG